MMHTAVMALPQMHSHMEKALWALHWGRPSSLPVGVSYRAASGFWDTEFDPSQASLVDVRLH